MRIGGVALRAGLVLVSTAVGLKVADLVVRAVDPMGISHFDNHYRFTKTCLADRDLGPPGHPFVMAFPIAGAHVKAGVDYRINSLGFRGREYAQEKPPGTWRIVVLGDSVTFGWGVEMADRFTDVVEARLNLARHDGRKIEILNLAVPGYESHHQFHVFKFKALGLQPDAFCYVFNQNDVQVDTAEQLDLASLGNARKDRNAWLGHLCVDEPWRSWMDATLPSLRLLGVYHYVYSVSEEDEHTLRAAYEGMKQGIEITVSLYQQTLALCRERNVAFGVCDLHDFGPIRDGCVAKGVPYVNICYPASLSDLSLRNSAADPHPNAKGHLKLADNFEAALVKMHLVPEGGN